MTASEASLASNTPAVNRFLQGPILPTLLRLAGPNVVSLTAAIAVAIAETVYVGRLGVEPLAGLALAFPLVLLMQNMSSSAMGGGVTSAIARALGAGNDKRASALAVHAIIIALVLGLVFTVAMLMFGRQLLFLLGGREVVLTQATEYVYIVFSGAVFFWLLNTFGAILRASGSMKLPAGTYVVLCSIQIVTGGALTFGLGSLPALGIRGVAMGMLIANVICTLALGSYVLAGRSRVKPSLHGLRLQWEMFADILKVGVVSCFSPLQLMLSILILTAMMKQFGTEAIAGFGIGTRLETLFGSAAFAVGAAAVPLVGMNIGAGQIARARRIAWTSGALAFCVVGAVGSFFAIFPDIWIDLFTQNAGVRAVARDYLRIAGFPMAFVALTVTLYFCSQGAAKAARAVLAQTARLSVLIAGGALLAIWHAPLQAYFGLAVVAMLTAGLFAVAVVHFARWGTPQAIAADRDREAANRGVAA